MATHYEHVQQILANAAAGAFPNHDGHGRFWQLELADFKILTIYGVQLIADPGPNRGRDSGLVRALRGEGPFDGTLFGRMPLGRPPVAPADIQFIEDWIDADLPNEEIGDELEDTAPAEPDEGRPQAPPSSYRRRYEPPRRPKDGYLIKNCNLIRESGSNIKIRKNITALTDQELANFRAAIQALKDLPNTDERNYNDQAAIHGSNCRHNSELFLPWHRAYLYRFELLLQEQVPGVTLPYWDWVNIREVPQAYLEGAGLPDFDPNPLFNPTRLPGNPSMLPEQDEQDDIQNQPDFVDYGGAPVATASPGQLELNNHNGIHVWVEGDMGSVPTAGFDPLFWALHCNIDRLWAEWQTTHTGGPSVPDHILEPFNMAISQTAYVRDLGYDYAALDRTFVLDNTVGCANYRSGDADLPEDVLERGCKKAKICLHNVKYPKDSYSVRVFINALKADAETKTKGNPSYAGSFSTFGHGECVGGKWHCDPTLGRTKYDLRQPHHFTPYSVYVDVTECLNRMCKTEGVKGQGKKPAVQICLVAVDRYGKQMPDDCLHCDGISLMVYE